MQFWIIPTLGFRGQISTLKCYYKILVLSLHMKMCSVSMYIVSIILGNSGLLQALVFVKEADA